VFCLSVVLSYMCGLNALAVLYMCCDAMMSDLIYQCDATEKSHHQTSGFGLQ